MKILDFNTLNHNEPIDFTYEQLVTFWNTIYSEAEFNYTEGLEIVNKAFLLEAQQNDNDGKLLLLGGSWRIKLRSDIVKTSVTTALLAGLFSVTTISGSLSAIVMPAIIHLLFDLENVKLTVKEKDIHAKLTLNAEVLDKLHSVNELYDLLPEEYKKLINFLDFTEFIDKFIKAGLIKEKKGNQYKLFKGAKFKIIIE